MSVPAKPPEDSSESRVKKGFAKVREKFSEVKEGLKQAGRKNTLNPEERADRIEELQEEKKLLRSEVDVMRLKRQQQELKNEQRQEKIERIQRAVRTAFPQQGQQRPVGDSIHSFYFGGGNSAMGDPYSDHGEGDRAWTNFYGIGGQQGDGNMLRVRDERGFGGDVLKVRDSKGLYGGFGSFNQLDVDHFTAGKKARRKR